MLAWIDIVWTVLKISEFSALLTSESLYYGESSLVFWRVLHHTVRVFFSCDLYYTRKFPVKTDLDSQLKELAVC